MCMLFVEAVELAFRISDVDLEIIFSSMPVQMNRTFSPLGISMFLGDVDDHDLNISGSVLSLHSFQNFPPIAMEIAQCHRGGNHARRIIEVDMNPEVPVLGNRDIPDRCRFPQHRGSVGVGGDQFDLATDVRKNHDLSIPYSS